MEYEIKGGSFPIVECTLKKGEKMISESGALCYMDHSIKMEATSNGGLNKVVGRLFTNEKLFQNSYTAEEDGAKVSFGTCVPGSIVAVELDGTNSLVCQKSAFLASYGDVELSTFFNKKIGVGLFGGEGFIMQKIVGKGIVFLEIDGSIINFELKEGEKKIISTGHLVCMDETCAIDIESVGGLKNMFLGGEGLFHTIVTGPGKVVIQTMPLAKFAASLKPFMPTSHDSSSSHSSSHNN